jgi:hypothetical protein
MSWKKSQTQQSTSFRPMDWMMCFELDDGCIWESTEIASKPPKEQTHPKTPKLFFFTLESS